MFKQNINGITINSVFDVRRALSNGLYPIRIIVTYRRVRKSYPTGISLSKKEWERLPTAKNTNLIRSKQEIQFTFNHIAKIIEIVVKDGFFSFDKLNRRLGLNIDSTLDLAYANKIARLNEDEKHNTSDTYKYSLQSLIDFNGDKIKFTDITIEYLRKYEKYMLGINRSYTTIAIFLRNLKAIMNDALKAGIINADQFPFGSDRYVIPQHAGRKIALNKKDIRTIVHFECKNRKQQFCRDLWFFSYLCNGANFADISNLKFDNIKGDNIEFYRQKTLAKSKVKKMIVAHLAPEMKAIIDEWGNEPVSGNYIFPILTDKDTSIVRRNKVRKVISSTNHYMKGIGKQLKIENISTYAARHSFATVLKRSGSNIAYISESLGHSNLIVTENYLSSFEDGDRAKNSRLLTAF